MAAVLLSVSQSKVDSCGYLDPQLVRPGLTANIGILNVQAMTERGV